MARINPLQLRRLREKLHLSQDDLSRHAKIDKATIYRIEAGETNRSNARTISELSKCLKVDPEQLTATEADPEDAQSTILAKTKLTMQVSAESRNALSLVAARYNVKPSDILEFAPLLFHLAASESLKQRSERLAELRAARDVVARLDVKFRHLAGRLVSDWPAEELEELEARSIAARDLRSALIDDDTSHTDPRPYDYDGEDQNPFVEHLRARLAAVQADGASESLESWSEYFGPRYAICHDEARAYFDGDDDAANDLIWGFFNLTDIPKEWRGAENGTERAAWATAEREKRAAVSVEDLLSSFRKGGQ